MTYLLDTNIVSELSKPQPSMLVIEWMEANGEQAALSSLTVAEMAAGIEALPAGKRRNDLDKRLHFLLEDFADRILPFDNMVAWEWARHTQRLRELGASCDLIDSMIAATGLAWGLKVVTRNVDDFAHVETVNPFDPA